MRVKKWRSLHLPGEVFEKRGEVVFEECEVCIIYGEVCKKWGLKSDFAMSKDDFARKYQTLPKKCGEVILTHGEFR